MEVLYSMLQKAFAIDAKYPKAQHGTRHDRDDKLNQSFSIRAEGQNICTEAIGFAGRYVGTYKVLVPY